MSSFKQEPPAGVGDSYVSMTSAATTTRQSKFTDIPEARHLTWSDDYYDDREDIVAVFDRNRAAASSYSMCWETIPGMIVFFSIVVFLFAMSGNYDFRSLLGIYGIAAVVCIVKLLWGREPEGQVHVAVSTAGIEFDYWVWISGKYQRHTIPFENFDKCQVQNSPLVGLACCMAGGVHRVVLTNPSWTLTFSDSVDVGTPRISRHSPIYYPLVGLCRPQEFVDLVMALKRHRSAGIRTILPPNLNYVDAV